MAWKIKFTDEATVALDDISPDVFERIAADDGDVSWWGVYAFPAGKPERLYRVIEAAAELAGVDAPERPATMRDAARLVDLLERVDDVEDMPMADGFPQTPDAPENGSTSGAPGDSDGPPTSPDDSESATS